MSRATIVQEDVWAGNTNSLASTHLSNGYVVSTIVRNDPLVRTMDAVLSVFPSDDRVADLSAPGAYETMVFRCNEDAKVDDWTELDFARCDSEGAAKTGHREMVRKWGKK